MGSIKLILSFWAFALFSNIISSTNAEAEPDLMDTFIKPAFDEVNALRQKYNLPLLTLDPKLVQGAQEWADSEAKNDQLKHSCGPCDDYSELLAQKITTGNVPRGKAAVDWALNRWFGSLIAGTTPTTDAANAYAALLKKPNLSSMGIGIAYGVTNRGEKTAFAVARFKRTSKSRWG